METVQQKSIVKRYIPIENTFFQMNLCDHGLNFYWMNEISGNRDNQEKSLYLASYKIKVTIQPSV